MSNNRTSYTNILLVVIIGFLSSPIWLPLLTRATGANTPYPTSMYPTVPVEDIQTGVPADSLGSAATNAPPNVSLIEIFPDPFAAAKYFNGYLPGYTENFLPTAGGEAIGVGAVSEETTLTWFGKTFEIPWDLSKVVAEGITKVVVQVATNRDKIYKGLEIHVVDDTHLNATVHLDVECASLVAVPISTENARDPSQNGQVNIQTQAGIIQKPSRWMTSVLSYYTDFDPYSVGSTLNDMAESAAAQNALNHIVSTDRLHLYHVESVTRPGQNSQYANIISIARDAICDEIESKGRDCAGIAMEITVEAAPAPEQLLWCGSGYPVSDLPYAVENVGLED